jgi:branched-chain amino acid transport system ATP-binding protein
MASNTVERPILTVKNLGVNFHGLHALEGYELQLTSSEILGVIGPNGAGKTTLFNLLTGYLLPTHGEIVFLDRKVNGWRPDQIAKLGMARTFQTIRLFGGMSVLENVKTAHQIYENTNFAQAMLSTKDFRSKERQLEEEVLVLLKLFHLDKHAAVPAKNLAYGDQRRLEMVRALATRPKKQPACDRSLFGKVKQLCSPLTISASITTASRPSRASPSRSMRASWWR